MGGPSFELVSRCSNCYGDSPKTYRREQSPTKTKSASEYQSAYREWPWQPKLQALRPGVDRLASNKDQSDQARSAMHCRTTYGVDYVYNSMAAKKVIPSPRKSRQLVTRTDVNMQEMLKTMEAPRLRIKQMQLENGQVIQPTINQPFKADTNYVCSYKAHDNATIAGCKQPAIKAKDNIEVPATGDATGNTKSTAQEDFIKHENVPRPEPIRPVENQERPTDPLDDRTEYKDFYTAKNIKTAQSSPIRKKLATLTINDQTFSSTKFDAVSTAMADFVMPKNAERPTACIPPVSDHFSKDKFDVNTTFHDAFKPWPVKRYEPPIWAHKPKYKRPEGGIIRNSLYMHDFRNPEMIGPPSPIRPNDKRYNVINRDLEDVKLEKQTTYKADYRVWEDAKPRETYRVIEIYAPPKEKMQCETNQRSSFKGERSERMTPCRHVSQHRDLHTDVTMTFGTTYNEAFINPHNETGLSSSTGAYPLTQADAGKKVAMPNSNTMPKVKNTGEIPTPNLIVVDKTNAGVIVVPPDTVTSPEVNILKLDQCEKCQHSMDQCTCSKA